MALDKLVDSTQLDSDLTSVANAIRAKSGGSSQLAFPAGFVSEIGNIPSGGTVEVPSNDVNFLDYDGTILHSYSASDFANLSELPANPTHTGLTSQGWNWTLADAKTQVAAVGFLDIGQMYVTDDGKTRVYVRVSEERKSMAIGLAVNGTVTIDWGDGTATDTITGTSATTVKYSPDHTYPSSGDYVIKISSSSGFAILGSASGPYLISKASNHGLLDGLTVGIRKIELGTSVRLYNYALFKCNGLESVTIPKDTTIDGMAAFNSCLRLKSVIIPSRTDSADISIPNSFFVNCYSLQTVSFPKKAVSFGSVFTGCSALKRVSFSNSATTFGNDMLKGCTSLERVNYPSSATTVQQGFVNGAYTILKFTVPSGVTSIGNAALYTCKSLKELHFLPTAPPAVSASNTFQSLPTDCTIYVPTGKLSAYTSASNYPSSVTYTYVEE